MRRFNPSSPYFRVVSRALPIALSCPIWLSGSLTGYAQAIPDAVKSIPGVIFQENMRPEAQHKGPETPSLLRAPEPQLDQEALQPKVMDASLNRKFFVKTIEIENAKHITGNQVDTLLSQYENKDDSFLDLQDLAQKLTQLYQDAGYVTSVVYIGPQKIENGHVVLTAAEGIVGQLHYKEGKYFKSRAILPRINLAKGETFNVENLKRSLREINENPDVKVRSILTAGDSPQETAIELENTEEHFPFHVTPFFDNLGRASIGNLRYGITSTHNNLFGFGDQASNTVVWTKSSFGTITHYQVPVGHHGTWLNFDQSFSTLKVISPEFKALNIHGNAKIYTPSITQELMNTERTKISADLAFDFMNINVYTPDNGYQNFSKDRLRVIRPGLNFDSYDRFGRTVMRHELGIGVDLFDATLNTQTSNNIPSSRNGGGGQFFRYTGNIMRLQKLPWDTFAILRASAQLSPNLLVSAQQFQMGGMYSVRGYKQGDFLGDSAYLLSAEWRVPLFFGPKTVKFRDYDYNLHDNIQLVSFIDMGQVFTNRHDAATDPHSTLLGIGVGVRVNLTQYLAGRVDMGIPLRRHEGERQVPRIYFGLESRLF